MRRGLTAFFAIVTMAVLSAPASAALRLVGVASGFTNPVHLASTPSEPGRLYVVTQRGYVRLIQNGTVRATPFLDVHDLVSCCGEQGLLSLAFHPGYAQNGRLFVNYTNRSGDTRVVEFRANSTRTRALRSTMKIRLAVDQPYSNHNGGQIAFGKDGYLYIGMGDGGSGGDPENRAQNISSRLGKLLRLNVNVSGATPRIVALGLRNPWRFSVDALTGTFYVADVGQSSWEEVDLFRPGADGLENFGWRVYEGRHVYDNSRPLYQPSKLVFPIHEYSHSNGCSITGGFVGRGRAPSESLGRYFFGDYCTGAVWSFRYANGQKSGFRREPFTVPGNLSSFGVGPRGGIYLVSHNDGRIFRLGQQ